MRIDKYIWAIRLFKTRSLASKACIGEKVKLNGDFIKSSKVVKKNDVIAIKVVPIWRIFKIIDLPKTRVGAKLVGDFSKEILHSRILNGNGTQSIPQVIQRVHSLAQVYGWLVHGLDKRSTQFKGYRPVIFDKLIRKLK